MNESIASMETAGETDLIDLGGDGGLDPFADGTADHPPTDGADESAGENGQKGQRGMDGNKASAGAETQGTQETQKAIDPAGAGGAGFNPFLDPFATPEELGMTAVQPPKGKGGKASLDAAAAIAIMELATKPPVFEYAGASEAIEDASTTFDELRIEKSGDFPELEDAKSVSWTVEYGKVTKFVTDPQEKTVAEIKEEIEASKEFADSLKKAKEKERNPVCKVKPRVRAQSKGAARIPAYKGVFTNMEDAEAAGKAISLLPARDGKVYEVRRTPIGVFSAPTSGDESLCEIFAGFRTALPLVPQKILMQAVSFFRHFALEHSGFRGTETLLNVYWDAEEERFIADAPKQTATDTAVTGEPSEEYDDERYIHFMDMHSHGQMPAYFSETDDADERATRLYAVIGKLDEPLPEMKTRLSCGGKFMEISPQSVFERPSAAYPQEWRDAVTVRRGFAQAA